MRAITIASHGGPEVLSLQSLPVPAPGDGEVLIRVAAAAVNFIDTLIRSGALPQMVPELPVVPGVECSGIVESVGAGVLDLAAGDAVVYMGGATAGCYAEYVRARAEYVWKLPDGADLQAAAVLPVNYATAYHMLHNLAGVQSGQTVLVRVASGGVGTALVQLAKLAGLRVIATVRNPGKAQYVLDQGADHVVEDRDQDMSARVLALTGGRGVNAAFNPVAGRSVVEDAAMLAPFGQVVLFGMLGGVPDVTLTEVLVANFGKSIAVRVSDVYTFYKERPRLLAEAMRTLIDAFSSGQFTPHYRTLPLAQAEQAHRDIELGKVVGKLLLRPQSADGPAFLPILHHALKHMADDTVDNG